MWLLIAASAAITGYLLVQFYWQTTARQIAEADEVAARACRTIGDRYRFYTTGWIAKTGPVEGATLQRELGGVVATALAHIPGVEGGIWEGTTGPLAYAYPTYEGTGPRPTCRRPSCPRSARSTVKRWRPMLRSATAPSAAPRPWCSTPARCPARYRS